jgi:hypothetical protein
MSDKGEELMYAAGHKAALAELASEWREVYAEDIFPDPTAEDLHQMNATNPNHTAHLASYMMRRWANILEGRMAAER